MKFAKFVEVHGPEVGAIASFIFIAAVELACGFDTDDDAVVHFTRSAACSFLTLAVLIVGSLVRMERVSEAEMRGQR